MRMSPNSLQEICLDEISENIRLYTNCKIMQDFSEMESLRYACTFKDSSIFLIQRISELLMNKLLKKKLLTNSTLSLFSEENTTLKRVKIDGIKVNKGGMMFLKNHKITDLECTNLSSISIIDIMGKFLFKISVSDMIHTCFSDCMNTWSVQNLYSANFAKCLFLDSSNYCYMVKILSFKNIRSLGLAYTELNQYCLEMICTDLKFLVKLDISGTFITCLKPLRLLQRRLKSLAIAVSIDYQKILKWILLFLHFF